MDVAARSPVRIRLCFPDPDTLSRAQALQGLSKSWYLVNADVPSIAHLVARIVYDYRLHHSCPHGVALEMAGFVLPPAQSTRILQDSDLVSVRRKQDGGSADQSREQITNSLSLDNEETDQACRTRRGGLLALEEFEKEAGGYQSEHSEDGDMGFSLGSGKNLKDGSKGLMKLTAKASSGKKRKHAEAQTLIDDLATPKSRKRAEALDLEPLAVKKPKSLEKKKRKKVTDGDHGSSQLLALEGLPVDEGTKTEKKKKKKVRDSVEPTGPKLNSGDVSGSKKPNKLEAKRSKERKAKPVKEAADLEGPHVKVAGEENTYSQRIRGQGEELNASIESRIQKLTPEADRERKKPRERQDISQVYHGTESLKKKRDVKENDGSLLNNESSPAEKKQPSRSARRKKAKKRWLREQKQNGVVSKQDNVKSQQKEEVESSESETSSEEDVAVEEAAAEEVEAEEEILPVMVAPGHIRFERDEDVSDVGHRAPIVLSYPEVQCKKQGQAWGQEKCQGRYSKDGQDIRSGKKEDKFLHVMMEQSPNARVVLDFEKLPLLNRAPRVGDLLAYRLVELTASWTPELSNYRVGKVSSHDDTTKMISMIPVPEYPIYVQQPVDVDENGQPYEQPDEDLFLPPYNSDGTLEVTLSTLMEVRILEEGPPGCSTATQAEQEPVDVSIEPLQPVTLSVKIPQENLEPTACINLNSASTAVSSQGNEAKMKDGGDHEAGGPFLTTQTEPVLDQRTQAGWQDVLSEEINKKKLELALRASKGSEAQNLCDKVQDQNPTESGVRHNVSKNGAPAENVGAGLPRTNGAPIIRHRYLRTGALGPTMALLRASQVL